MKRIFRKTLILVLAVLALLCASIGTASARTLSIVHIMDNYVAGERLTILWDMDVPGAHHYDCTILNTTTGVYVRSRSTSEEGFSAYVSGSRITAGRYKVWVGAVSADGRDIATNITYFTVSDASECEHEWNSRTGMCRNCDEECPHNNGVIQVDDDWDPESISSTHHRIVYYYNEKCRICRYVLHEGKTRTEKEPHQFDANGDCEVCDYRVSCTHSRTNSIETYPTYTQYDETYHKVKVIIKKVCANANCGKVVEDGIIRTSKAKHNMSGGRCQDCGYAKSYDPLSVSISRNSASAYTGSTIGASCSASGGSGKYSYVWYVYRNGVQVESSTFWAARGSYSPSQPGSYTFKVIVVDKTTNEQKTATSAAISVTNAPCQHTSTTKVQDGKLQYTKISDSKHSIRTNWVDVCTACSATVRSYYSTSEAAHSYSGGNCIHCGCAEPARPCTHPAMTSRERSRKCRASASATEHYVDVTWEDRCSNTACGVLLNNSRVTTVKEAHTFSGDVCTKCSYARVSQKGCDHAAENKTRISSTVKTHDGSYHAVVTTYKVTCANASCAQVLSSSRAETTYEKHAFNGLTCTACGYRKACSHPHESKASQGATAYEIADARQHYAVTIYTVTCKDCGVILDGSRTERISFNHTMVDGRCRHCGYQAAAESRRELVSTRLINESPEMHKIVETWKVTRADGAVATEETVRYEKHGVLRTGVEANHPHKQFTVCQCGARPYTGKEVANASCTLCNPAPQQPVIPQQPAAQPDCTVTGNHAYSTVIFAAEHPHKPTHAICKCGAITYDVAHLGDGESLTCCKCGYHSYGGAVPNGGYYDFHCSCGHVLSVEGTAAERMGEFFIQADLALGGRSDPFRVIGAAAINKLTDGGYVGLTEAMNATKDVGKTITGAVVGMNGEDYHELQIQQWEYLIVQMLIRNPEYGYEGEAMDMSVVYGIQNGARIADDVTDTYENLGRVGIIKTVDDWIAQYDGVIASLMQNKSVLQQAVDAGTATQEQILQWNQVTEQINQMSETRTTLYTMSKEVDAAGKTADIISFAVEGFLIWENTNELYTNYYVLGKNYEENERKLNSIIISAQAIGKTDVVIAAQRVQERLYAEQETELEDLQRAIATDSGKQIGGKVVERFSTDVINTTLRTVAPPTLIINAMGSTADLALGWGPSYASAQRLMMLRDMDNLLGTDVRDVLVDDPENGRFLAELYIVLQIEGLNQTKVFLKDYESARGLSVAEFNIHDLDKYNSSIDRTINARSTENAALDVMYQQYCTERETLDAVVITSPTGILRAGPSVQSGYVLTAYQGMSFPFIERVDSWYKVLYNGEEAYISMSVSTLE